MWIVTIGFLFSSNVDRQDWLQKSLLESVLSNWAVITSFGFRISFEQLEQVFLVEAGGREAGMVYPVRHSVEQKSWVEPFLW